MGDTEWKCDGGEEYLILYKTGFKNTVSDVFKRRSLWRETRSETEWDLYWADTAWIRESLPKFRLDADQKVNHFRNHYELSRKDLLAKNLKRLKRQAEKNKVISLERLDFFPTGFVLPSEYQLFLEHFRSKPRTTWIMKPIAKAQGKGIFLFTKISQINEWKKDHSWQPNQQRAENYVVQKYITHPYLIGGKKFDLRLYVLVTSFSPLKVWIHRLGFARFSTTKYSVSKQHLSNTYMHLTNYSIQKQSGTHAYHCKLDVHTIKCFLLGKHGMDATELLFARIQDLIVNSLLAAQPSMIQDPHCFELYGYDVLIDADLKPWLVEVNASPSLTKSDQEDQQMKSKVIHDLLNVIDLEGELSGFETQIGGFDLIYDKDDFQTDPLLLPTQQPQATEYHVAKIGCLYSQHQVAERKQH